MGAIKYRDGGQNEWVPAIGWTRVGLRVSVCSNCDTVRVETSSDCGVVCEKCGGGKSIGAVCVLSSAEIAGGAPSAWEEANG